MSNKIRLKLVEEGVYEVEVDRAEYEQAKAGDELVDFLDPYASNIPTDWWVIEPDGTKVQPTY